VLIEVAKIPVSDVFDYEESPIKELYDKYFQFCQENLSEKCKEHAIQPAKFYYRNEYGINARAGMLNGYFIIGVNMQTIHLLYQFFYVKNDTFESDEHLVGTYSELSTKFDVPAGHLMFQLAILFTFYHERAHLIQKSPNLMLGLSEKLDDSDQREFVIGRHILELDADLDAAQEICFHLFDYWKKLKQLDRTENNLQKILSLGIASIFSYFLLYFDRSMKIYYDQHTHPHPLVRITYIVDCFIDVAQKNAPIGFSLDARATLREGFVVSEVFSQNVFQANIVQDYADQFKTEGKNIENYVNELLSEAERIPNLVKNRNGSL
jgi:hypothetical protein